MELASDQPSGAPKFIDYLWRSDVGNTRAKQRHGVIVAKHVFKMRPTYNIIQFWAFAPRVIEDFRGREL